MSPPSLPTKPDDLLDLLETQLGELERYLFAQELFWPLGSAVLNYPKLTLGNLLLVMRTLEANPSSLDPHQQARLLRYATLWDQARAKWASAIGAKALREMGARLNLWRGFLDDLTEGHAGRYHFANEVRNRVLFALLGPLAPDEEQAVNLHRSMRRLDGWFSTLSTPASFVWEDPLQPRFPSETFPFLYRAIAAGS